MKMSVALFLILCVRIVCAQTAKIVLSGIVEDERTSMPLENVNIILQSKNGGYIYGATLTDGKGCFSIHYAGNNDSLNILVSGFNVKPKRISVTCKSQHLRIKAISQSIQIREVVIKSTPIEYIAI